MNDIESDSTTTHEVQSVSFGSEEAAALYCQPCEVDNKQEPAYGYCKNCAEHLCEECYRTHKKPAPLRGHILLDSSQMPQIKGPVPDQSIMVTCAVHDGESIKYLCNNHNIVGCDLCVDINHRNCKTININDVAHDFQSSQEYKNLLQRILEIKSKCIDVNKTMKTNMQTTQNRRQTIRNEIENTRKQINDQIDQLLTENDKIHDAENVKATSALFEGRDILQKVEQLEENLKGLEKAGNNTKFFIQAMKDESTLKDLQTKIDGTERKSYINTYEFRKNKETYDLLGSGIGKIVPKPGLRFLKP